MGWGEGVLRGMGPGGRRVVNVCSGWDREGHVQMSVFLGSEDVVIWI
jgi:hypothetical protein